jgi:hypothetical protein
MAQYNRWARRRQGRREHSYREPSFASTAIPPRRFAPFTEEVGDARFDLPGIRTTEGQMLAEACLGLALLWILLELSVGPCD